MRKKYPSDISREQFSRQKHLPRNEYFRIWSEKKEGEHESILEYILREVVGETRVKDGRKEKTSFIIIDKV